MRVLRPGPGSMRGLCGRGGWGRHRLILGGRQWVGARWRRGIMPGGSSGRAGSSGFRCCVATARCSSPRGRALGCSGCLSSAARLRRRPGGPHDVACAWTAACLEVVRSSDPAGAARRSLVLGAVGANSSHQRPAARRPDFVGLVGDDRIAVEVELAPQSKRRLTRFCASTASVCGRDGHRDRPPAESPAFRA